MKNLLVAVLISGVSVSSFASSFSNTETCYVKYDKKKNKKKSKKKGHHGKCEAYNG
ncbi:MAG: hypothetical protein ACK457_03175 [Flavobacteriia bacterium]